MHSRDETFLASLKIQVQLVNELIQSVSDSDAKRVDWSIRQSPIHWPRNWKWSTVRKDGKDFEQHQNEGRKHSWPVSAPLTRTQRLISPSPPLQLVTTNYKRKGGHWTLFNGIVGLDSNTKALVPAHTVLISANELKSIVWALFSWSTVRSFR